MHSKLLSTILIIVLLLGVMPATQAAQPAATELPAAPVPTANAAPQAQPPLPERQMPARVRELSTAELESTADVAPTQVGNLPQALRGEVAEGQKTMLIVELAQAPLATFSAQRKASGQVAAAADIQSYRASLESAQAVVQSQLEALGVQVVSNYTTVYNGFLAYVPQNQVDAIRQIPGVVGVHRAPQHVPALGTSVPLIGAPEVCDELDYDGTGVVIAIIDTGIDYTHAVLGGSGDPADYADNDPDMIEAGTFPTAKVIGGWDFAGTTYNADSTSAAYQPIPDPDRDPLDENSHGTHVSSIAAGQAAGQVSTGTAPGAKLMALKVFGAEGSTNLTMNALDMATYNYLLHGWPQVINMSLGSSYGPGDYMADPDIVATNNAVAAGIVVAASAGNSGDLYYSTGSPGNADKAIGVAGSTTGWVTGPTVDVTGSTMPTLTNIIYMPPAFSADGHYLTPLTATLAYAGNYSSQILCAGSTANPADAFQGKVVLIERGTCAFTEKVRTAKSLGAVGALIFNSAAGGNTYITMADDGLGNLIPAGFLARQDGLNLRTADGQTVAVSAENQVRTVQDRYMPPDSVYPSSSRGPRGTDSMLKPEVGAPGYNIFAAAMGTGVEGVSYSGTSMAAPHVAGVAALMVQAHPNWTPEEIKAAMMNTAVDYVDGTPIPRQGAGRVDAYRAVTTPVHAVGDADFVSISGYFATDQATQVIERDVMVHNTDTVSHTYAVSWQHQGASLHGLAVAFSADEVVVGPGAVEVVKATFTFTMADLPAEVGTFEEIYGYIVFTPPALHRIYLPLVINGSATAAAAAVRPQVLVGSEDTLRVPFYFVPRPYNKLEITAQTTIADPDNEWATFEITHTGPISSSLWVYPLLVSDPKETNAPGDVRAVGVDYGGTSGTYGPILTFAINAWAPWHLPYYYFAEFDIYIDNNEDGVADYVFYNAPVAGSNLFVPRVINLSTGAGVNSPYTIYVDYNSGYMELYVPAAQLGLNAANTTFDFQVIGFDYGGNADVTAPGRFDFARWPINWDADTLEPGPADPNAEVYAWVRDNAGYAYSQPQGVMIVDYTGNPQNGGEVYLYDLDVTLPLDLTILHTNDFHARIDEYDVGGGACTTPATCIGGYARLATLVKGVRAATPNVLLVDAGDQFQGTLYYNLFKSEVVAKMMNTVGYDAMTVGNHELDDGPAQLGLLAGRTDFPIVSSNLDVSNEPTLAGMLAPYTIVERNGESIGILGVTTPELPDISSPGPNVVVKDPAASVQAEVNKLQGQGIDKIVLLSHLGYDADVALAAAVTGVDVIVGGHSHTFLYDPPTAQSFISPTLALTPAGPYPTVVGGPTVASSAAGEPVLIVAAFEWGKFLGRLDVTFNGYGVVTAYDGNPIYVNNTVAKDAAIDTMLAPYRTQVTALMTQKIGEITVDAPISVGGKRICRLGECLMGNLVTDAMLWQVNTVGGGDYQIAVTNGGGLRAALLTGDVTYGGVLGVLPFGNTIATMELKGADLLAALEHSVRSYPGENGGFLQVSGMRYAFDPNAAVGSRIIRAEVWNGVAYEPIVADTVYKVVTNNFTRTGGDGYTWFRDNAINPYDGGPALHEAVINYFKTFSPVTPMLEGRIGQLEVITILHTNDTHGRWEMDTYGGGMLRLATLIEQQRARNPNTILLDAGDTFQGNAFAYFFKDAADNPIAGGLELLDYDAMMLGNHEFNFGPATFQTMIGQVDFPVLGSANLTDDGRYGLAVSGVQDYTKLTVGGKDVVIWGFTNPRVPRYELPSNIVGLTFKPFTETFQSQVPAILAAENPDLFIALNHLGYEPYAGEDESDVLMAKGVAGIDVIIGSHSHTKLDPAVMVTSPINPEGTLIAQTQAYAVNLGVIDVGFVGDEIVYRRGYLIPANTVTTPNATLQAYLNPYIAQITAYNGTVIGKTSVPLDALNAFTQETNAANLQADAAAWALAQKANPVDFHLSGAMTNRKVASDATLAAPLDITKGDMFTLMPYENSLVVLELNGAQLKNILERGYRNYWYYKYQDGATPRWGGYSHYTTCMLDVSKGAVVTYSDPGAGTPPNGNNVLGMTLNGNPIDFTAATTYTVSSVNYLVAGSCNFNDAGVTLWPLDQITFDSQIYVRDSVTDYVATLPQPIAPAIEGRLVFQAP